MDIDDDARTLGRLVRQIRNSRGKSLEVIAGLSGISRSSLSRIERGERALDSRSATVALANALQISPAELTRLPVPTPANGDKDAVVTAIRRALIAVSRDDPGGQVVPLNALRTRVEAVAAAQRECAHEQVGRALPALIRDVHTSMAAGGDLGELLALAVLLHVQDTQAHVGAVPIAGGRRRQPPRGRDRPIGARERASATYRSGQCLLAGLRADECRGVADGSGIGSSGLSAGCQYRGGVAARTAPEATRRAAYWSDYGRALARLRGRQDDAVRALRRAERISPARVQRHPFVRGVLAELLSKPHRGTMGRELRGMAYRAGLPV